MKIYPRHTQKNAVDFANYVLERFPFRIHTIQTDNGHHGMAMNSKPSFIAPATRSGVTRWHCEDLGIRHVYIKPASPHLNGKVAAVEQNGHMERIRKNSIN